ncbi:N-acetyltransferase family protein [Oryzobacter sp. R7]|uniref:GNAT family N-acetyltransferase n=1 Tax=Oryzobacter faecalis TaxID=3388656 RepID=UPI00398CAAF9
MSEIEVRPLGVEDWELYRSVRLTALQESPDAFVASFDEEESEPEDFWRARMARSVRLLAERDGRPLGIASVGSASEDQPDAAQLFGLWVSPEARGSGVATELVRAGARTAAEAGKRHLLYWVGTDNGRAVAFASGFGFRPTAERRPMRVRSEDDGEEEVAMTLPLLGDRGGVAQF